MGYDLNRKFNSKNIGISKSATRLLPGNINGVLRYTKSCKFLVIKENK